MTYRQKYKCLTKRNLNRSAKERLSSGVTQNILLKSFANDLKIQYSTKR